MLSVPSMNNILRGEILWVFSCLIQRKGSFYYCSYYYCFHCCCCCWCCCCGIIGLFSNSTSNQSTLDIQQVGIALISNDRCVIIPLIHLKDLSWMDKKKQNRKGTVGIVLFFLSRALSRCKGALVSLNGRCVIFFHNLDIIFSYTHKKTSKYQQYEHPHISPAKYLQKPCRYPQLSCSIKSALMQKEQWILYYGLKTGVFSHQDFYILQPCEEISWSFCLSTLQYLIHQVCSHLVFAGMSVSLLFESPLFSTPDSEASMS